MIIKEYCQNDFGYRIVIRESSYGSGLDKFERLFEVARCDFPEITSSDVEIIHFSGKYYAKTFGIEFDVDTQPPSDYNKISTLEYRL